MKGQDRVSEGCDDVMRARDTPQSIGGNCFREAKLMGIGDLSLLVDVQRTSSRLEKQGSSRARNIMLRISLDVAGTFRTGVGNPIGRCGLSQSVAW